MLNHAELEERYEELTWTLEADPSEALDRDHCMEMQATAAFHCEAMNSMVEDGSFRGDDGAYAGGYLREFRALVDTMETIADIAPAPILTVGIRW